MLNLNLKKLRKLLIRLIYRAPDALKDAVTVVPVSRGRISVDGSVSAIIKSYLPTHVQDRVTFADLVDGLDCSVDILSFKSVKLIEDVDEWENRFFQILKPRLRLTAYLQKILHGLQNKDNASMIWCVEPWYPNYYHWLIYHVSKLIECDQQNKITGCVGMPIGIRESNVKIDSLKAINRGSFFTEIISGTWAGDLTYVRRRGMPIQGIRSLRDNFSVNSSGLAGRRIYITRNTALWRFIENESEMRKFLGDMRFEFVEFDGMSLADQKSSLIGAEIIVGVHGAGLANIVFAPKGSRLIEIAPDCLNDASYLCLCLICGINYTRLAARTISQEKPEYSNLEVDISALARILGSSPIPEESISSYFHVPAYSACVEIQSVI